MATSPMHIASETLGHASSIVTLMSKQNQRQERLFRLSPLSSRRQESENSDSSPLAQIMVPLNQTINESLGQRDSMRALPILIIQKEGNTQTENTAQNVPTQTVRSDFAQV